MYFFSLFFWNCERLWLIGNGTFCRPTFVNHSYDHRSKWSPLSLITIMFNWSSSFILPYKALCIFPWFDKMFFALHPSRISMISLIIQWQFIFVGLDEAKDINDSVSGQMSSSKYAGLQWWRELANEHTTLRTLILSFQLFPLNAHFSSTQYSLPLRNGFWNS